MNNRDLSAPGSLPRSGRSPGERRDASLVRPQDLANRIAGQSQIASDLFDRFALNKVLAPYPSDRLHNQHPPPPASRQSGQPNKPIIGGSIWTPIPRLRGSLFHAGSQPLFALAIIDFTIVMASAATA
jgi:hypothetical protein